MNSKNISYWACTVVLALALFSGGAAQVAHQPQTVEAMMRLGYPLYFATILGLWKILGAIALLAPRFPRLKEWAYAGIFFEMTGAAISHIACGDFGDYAFHIIAPLILVVLAIVSWATRPQSRIVGILFQAKTSAGAA
jgi:uncharacterized membrane protein YphA (DoxX/SURF4 family)